MISAHRRLARRIRDRRGDDGFSTVEFVLMFPLFLTVLAFIACVGRIATATGQVEGASRDAARAGSLSRNLASAQIAATSAAQATLAAEGITCGSLTVSLAGSSFTEGGFVRARVSCTASLSGLGMSGFPSSKTLVGVSLSPLEQYRRTA